MLNVVEIAPSPSLTRLGGKALPLPHATLRTLLVRRESARLWIVASRRTCL
jgi:hypothetical protein